VQALGLALALGDLRLAIPGQLTQVADRLGRHEVRPQQPRFGQLAQPCRVAHVGLAAGDLLDVAGVDEHQLEVVFEDVPHRLPIHPGGLHHDLADLVRSQPVAERQESSDRRSERGQVPLAAAVGGRDAHARGHARLVDIERRDALNDHVHSHPLRSIIRSPSARACEIKESDDRARAATVRSSGTDPDAKLDDGLASAIVGRRPQTAGASSPVFTRPEPAPRAERN
jgi:hypothetical protein